MKTKQCYTNFLLSVTLYCLYKPHQALSWSHTDQVFNPSKKYEGSSDLVSVEYHMGPVLASPIRLYLIWYGHWNPTHQATITDFLNSFSAPTSVADWWTTVRLYTDQTGSNITNNIALSGQFHDTGYSHGRYLSRLAIQSVIRTATTSRPYPLPLNPHNGLYLVLTSPDVRVQDFCTSVCGFHYFTFPNIVGVPAPFAWVGHSGTQCPGLCAYPFAWPEYSGKPPPGGSDIMRAPNGDAGVDGMISVIAHELAETSSDPFGNGWYGGDDPTAPDEIADMCVGIYGSGGGGGYVGSVDRDYWGNGYNVYGVKGRKFLVQWVWNPVKNRCYGPNAMD